MILHPGDQYLLERYFSDGAAERSNAGGILDHLERYSVRHPKHARARGPDAHHPSCICPECTNEVTARPKAEVRERSKDGPDDSLVSLLGSVSRRLSVVRKADPTSYLVLAAWFGDAGARHAHLEGGRLVALLVHTPTGKDAVARVRAKERGATRLRSDAERVQAALADAHNVPLKDQVTRARVEAMALIDVACRAWVATAGPAKPRRLALVPHA